VPILNKKNERLDKKVGMLHYFVGEQSVADLGRSTGVDRPHFEKKISFFRSRKGPKNEPIKRFFESIVPFPLKRPRLQKS
jgi:hypothetical protein